MKAKLIFIIAFCINTGMVLGQDKDTVGITVTREGNNRSDTYLLNVTIKNLTHTPICVLSSNSVNLYYDPPQKLSRVREESGNEIYSLQHGLRDSLFIYETTNENNNINFGGEIILPLQEINFRISFYGSPELGKILHFEYFNLPDFCYKDFLDSMLRDAQTWYNKYKIVKRNVELPK